MTADLRVERDGGVLRLVIDREAKRNALSVDVLVGLLDAVQGLGPDDRVVLLASAGDRVFCAGADLAVMGNDATGLEQHDGRGRLRELVLALRAAPVPVVAAVQGICLAGGVGLVLGADVVLASTAASFGLPEVDRGLWPFMVSALLARSMAPAHAMDLMLSGERIDAETAQRQGLVSRVLPADGFADGVARYVGKLAGNPPVAMRLGKAAFGRVGRGELAAELEAMQAQLSLLTTTRDAAEGIAAFFDKRPPQWEGR